MKRLSNKNPYAISKYRQLELKYFCLQYDEWVSEIDKINLYLKGSKVREVCREDRVPDPTGELAVRLAYLKANKDLVDASLLLAGDVGGILFEGVTLGISYEVLEARRGGLPRSRKSYYDKYRRFMFILSCKKQGL